MELVTVAAVIACWFIVPSEVMNQVIRSCHLALPLPTDCERRAGVLVSIVNRLLDSPYLYSSPSDIDHLLRESMMPPASQLDPSSLDGVTHTVQQRKKLRNVL
jgi:hypothetical protein